jgi:hypothetical protein
MSARGCQGCLDRFSRGLLWGGTVRRRLCTHELIARSQRYLLHSLREVEHLFNLEGAQQCMSVKLTRLHIQWQATRMPHWPAEIRAAAEAAYRAYLCSSRCRARWQRVTRDPAIIKAQLSVSQVA